MRSGLPRLPRIGILLMSSPTSLLHLWNENGFSARLSPEGSVEASASFSSGGGEHKYISSQTDMRRFTFQGPQDGVVTNGGVYGFGLVRSCCLSFLGGICSIFQDFSQFVLCPFPRSQPGKETLTRKFPKACGTQSGNFPEKKEGPPASLANFQG